MVLEGDGSYSSPVRIHTQGVREMSPHSHVEVRLFDSPTTTSINAQGTLNSSLQSPLFLEAKLLPLSEFFFVLLLVGESEIF